VAHSRRWLQLPLPSVVKPKSREVQNPGKAEFEIDVRFLQGVLDEYFLETQGNAEIHQC